MKYKTFLFDFDGTLVDSMPSYVRAMLRILDEGGIKYEKDIVKIITPLGYLGTARYYREALGLQTPEEEIVALMKSYAYRDYAESIEAKKTVRETLIKMKAVGAELNILTASPHEVLDVCLNRLGIFDLFTNVWSTDDFGKTKADPKIYELAAERLGVRMNEILFVDDNYNAARTAKAAGMRVAGIYDETSAEYDEQINSVADYYVHNFSELIGL